MRLLAAAAVVTTCVAGAALALDESPSAAAPPAAVAFVPHFESTHGIRRTYPMNALEQGMAGIVHLCCSAQANRRLDCTVAIEWPQHHGFGDAAVRFARGFRMTPESYAELQAQQHQTLQIPFRYQVVPVPPELDGIAGQAHAQATDLCGPGTGEAPEYIVIEAQRLG